MASLVAYFSYSGVTKRQAEKLAEKAGADLFEIKAAQPYTAADVNWQDESSRNVKEYHDASSRPEIAGKTDLSKYDTVYVGFPIWWYTNPRIINTFFDSYDFTGKKVVLFATSGSTGVDGALKELRKTYPQINFVKGARIGREADLDKLLG